MSSPVRHRSMRSSSVSGVFSSAAAIELPLKTLYSLFARFDVPDVPFLGDCDKASVNHLQGRPLWKPYERRETRLSSRSVYVGVEASRWPVTARRYGAEILRA